MCSTLVCLWSKLCLNLVIILDAEAVRLSESVEGRELAASLENFIGFVAKNRGKDAVAHTEGKRDSNFCSFSFRLIYRLIILCSRDFGGAFKERFKYC